ncbi:uncharacterized protein [Narcine bancroftii]|uniref:uncharacterized protein n=1 Tax=Narcine bancroftii TaxID=1343680 RepID=UPI003831454E
MNSRTVEAIVNKDVLLDCRVSGYTTSEIDVTTMGVQWFFEKNGPSGFTKEKVYVFHQGEHTPYRNRAAVFDDELKRGIASLFLPHVQFNEEGDYTCVVFIKSDHGSGKSSMTVSAKPQVALSLTAVTIENGMEKSVNCYSAHFYPMLIEMRWLKKTKDKEEEILNHVCTGSPVKNNDGTYNVTSHIRLRPSLLDNDNTYVCFVRHRSLSSDIKLATHLTVKEPEVVIPGNIIAGSVFASWLICSLIMVIGFFLYLKYFRKVPPKVSDISSPPHIIHLENCTLSCQISGYKPQSIYLHWFLQRKGRSKEMIYRWTSNANLCTSVENEQHALISEDLSFNESFVFSMSVVKQISDGSASVNCKVKFCPDIDKDNEAILSLSVYHSTVKGKISKSIKLRVEGIAPKMTKVLAPRWIIHEEEIALTCPIDGFKPRPLAITWYQRENNILRKVVKHELDTQYSIDQDGTNRTKYVHELNELENIDHTYSVTSVLIFTPTILEDHDTIYICEVEHPATASKAQKEVLLNLKAIPKYDEIKLQPENPIVEEFAYSSCRIYSFFPKEIKVTWKMDGRILDGDGEAVLGKDGCYSLTSLLRFVPERIYFGKILRCEFQHESITEIQNAECKLDHLMSSPLIDNLKFEPQFPNPGEETTFLCRAHGFFPKEIQFMWFKNDKRIDDREITTTIPEIDKTTGLFNSESLWKYVILQEDHQIEIKVEALHIQTLHKLTKSFQILHLGGIPKVSEIIMEPENPFYGHSLILKCNVTNFYQDEISTNWLIDEKPITDGVTNQVTEKNKGYSQLCSSLVMTVTAFHYDKMFAFEVKPRISSDPIRKELRLPLPGHFPTVSEIKCHPTPLEENKMATFTVSLAQYIPQEIEVRWFKGEQPFMGRVDNSQPQIDAYSLYSSTTRIEFAPGPFDHNLEIRCEIIHFESKKTIEKKCHLTF